MQELVGQILVAILIAAVPVGWIWWSWRRMRQALVDQTEPSPEEPPGKDYFPLRDEWPSQFIVPRAPAPDEFPVDVYQCVNSMEAGLLKQQLESRGIRCEIEQRESGGYNSTSDLYIKVWSADEQVSREIICRLLRATPPEIANSEGSEGKNVLQYERRRV